MIWLSGVPGLINTLLNRLTDTRANNLDNLDTPISDTAPAATALSTANWPGTRDDLVNLIAQVSGATPKTLIAGSAYSHDINIYNKFDSTNATASHGLRIATSTTGSGSNNGADWETLLDIPGEAGTLKLVVFAVTSVPTAPNWESRITLDGSVIYSTAQPVGPYNPGVDSNTGRSVIGTLIFNTASPYELSGVTFEDIRFKSSCLIEVRRASVNTAIRLIHEYQLNQ